MVLVLSVFVQNLNDFNMNRHLGNGLTVRIFMKHLLVISCWSTSICISKTLINPLRLNVANMPQWNGLSLFGSGNGFMPVSHQTIIWTSTGLMLIEPFATNVVENLIKHNSLYKRKLLWKRCLQNADHFAHPQCFKISVCNNSNKLWPGQVEN